MVQKPFRFDNEAHVRLAIKLFEFESTKVAGPGSSTRKITDVIWTLKEAIEYMSLDSEGKVTFAELISSLKKQNHLLIIPNSINGEDGYVTRTAETLRIIGHTYEYWHKGRPGVDAIRWEIVPKQIPRRNISPLDMIQKLIDSISNGTGIDQNHTSLGKAIREVIQGIANHFRENEGIETPRFSNFQYESVKQGLLDALGHGGKGTVLVAGVGSGKTLAFMLTPLILSKVDIIEGKSTYGAHLFLYPRKALALDQFSKSLKPFALATGIPIHQVHSEMGKHYHTLPTKSVYKGIESIHDGFMPPRLVISSVETLKNRLSHPTISNKLITRLQSITFDEVHLQSGVQGAQTAMLMRRVGKKCPEGTTWVGASATIAKPENHLSRLFGLNPKSIRLVAPTNDEMQADGVVHHAFFRPNGLVSQAGVLTNATSLLVHHRRDNLSIRPGEKQSQNAPKVITFADNLEILGSWNDNFRENERTDVYPVGPQKFRVHPESDEMANWDQVQREIPYARRFQNTLERRIESQGGIIPEHLGGGIALEPVFTEWRGKEVCKRCKQGERFELGFADVHTMKELSKLVHRSPHKEEDPFIPFRIKNDEIFLKEGIIGTQEMCPYLQAAACSSFSNHPLQETRRIGNSSGGQIRYDFASRATSSIQSSKSEDFSEYASDLSLAVFRGPNRELHSVPGAKGDDFVDVVMASPSLEVGVDLPNLTESVMTKAVRNLASYRQKAGRVGRESMSEALNLTMATDSANDLHYYRQPRKLIDRGRLEPVPLKERNDAVAKSTAYLCIWDVIVGMNLVPEALKRHSMSECLLRFGKAKEFVDKPESRSEIHDYIASVLDDERYPSGTNWFDDAINQVRSEIDLLLKPVSGYEFQPPLPDSTTVIEGMRHLLGAQNPNSARPIGGADSLIENYEEELKQCNRHRSNTGFLRENHDELLERIDNILRGDEMSTSEIEEVSEEINELRKSLIDESQKRPLRKLKNSLENVEEAIDKLSASGIDLPAFRAIEQYQKLLRADEGSWKTYYFSATLRTLDVFKTLRKNEWFVSPDALYIHPHMKMVKLTNPDTNMSERAKELKVRDDQSLIPLSEALHSFLPGMWTRRLPQTTFKVLARETIPVGGRTLEANLEKMEQGGLKFEVANKALPAPPGLMGEISVISPIEIPIRPLLNRRTMMTDTITPKVLDYDEGNPKNRETKSERIPKSFSQRWLHVDLDEGVQVEAYLEHDENEKLIQTDFENSDEVELSAEDIAHPFANDAFTSIRWHNGAIVTEYSYGLSRTMKAEGGFGTEVFYTNNRGAHITFGQKINTEGIAFNLKKDTLNSLKDSISSKMIQGHGSWNPSLFSALRAYLRERSAELGQSPPGSFLLEDLISIVLAKWRMDGELPLTTDYLCDLSKSLIDNPEITENFVAKRVDARLQTPDDETQMTIDDQTLRRIRIDEMRTSIISRLRLLTESGDRFEKFLPKWIHRSILMTFGVGAVGATQRIAGGDTQEIGYGLTDESWAGADTTVVVYDRAECGNGNSSVAKTFMHIPNIIRSAKGTLGSHLPSMDFLSTLEEIILPCPQHHCDILGLEYHKTNGHDNLLHKSLVDYTLFGKEIYRVGSSVWNKLNLKGPKDGWKLPLYHSMRRELAIEIDQESDDVTRATKICWNGCPECVQRIDIVQGGYSGMDYLDKGIMNSWFRLVRDGSNEYLNLDPNALLNGTSNLQLGDLHSVALDTTRGRIRSVMLPWTIGVDLDRTNPSEGIRMIIRQSDLVGLRQTIPNQGVAMGMPSMAFKRLLWFDLLLNAYLDMRGAIEENNKMIKLVYYDARDVTFDDIGLAPQLLEALRTQAKIDGAGVLNTLSDMLTWLAIRGFEIQVCIDKRVYNKRQNTAVRNFVTLLKNSRGRENITVLAREVIDEEEYKRSMHKKTLISPLFVLKGTANMTLSGAGKNEEDVDHAMVGTAQYQSIKSSCNDTISQANPI